MAVAIVDSLMAAIVYTLVVTIAVVLEITAHMIVVIGIMGNNPITQTFIYKLKHFIVIGGII